MNYPINQVVLDVGEMNIVGNTIPMNWIKHLRRTSTRPTKTGKHHPSKPHHAAIMILGDIVYWHRPTVVRDEATGLEKGRYKKFKADRLQRRRRYYVNLFGYSKAQVSDALKFLKDQGVISLFYETVPLDDGSKLYNCMYIGLNVNRLKFITYEDNPITKNQDTLSLPNEYPITKNRHTNTETTNTETTNTDKNTSAPKKAEQTPTPSTQSPPIVESPTPNPITQCLPEAIDTSSPPPDKSPDPIQEAVAVAPNETAESLTTRKSQSQDDFFFSPEEFTEGLEKLTEAFDNIPSVYTASPQPGPADDNPVYAAATPSPLPDNARILDSGVAVIPASVTKIELGKMAHGDSVAVEILPDGKRLVTIPPPLPSPGSHNGSAPAPAIKPAPVELTKKEITTLAYELEAYFCEIAGLKAPNRSTAYFAKKAHIRWGNPCKEMMRLADYDLVKAKRFMDAAWAEVVKDNWQGKISTAQSIENYFGAQARGKGKAVPMPSSAVLGLTDAQKKVSLFGHKRNGGK